MGGVDRSRGPVFTAELLAGLTREQLIKVVLAQQAVIVELRAEVRTLADQVRGVEGPGRR